MSHPRRLFAPKIKRIGLDFSNVNLSESPEELSYLSSPPPSPQQSDSSLPPAENNFLSDVQVNQVTRGRAFTI